MCYFVAAAIFCVYQNYFNRNCDAYKVMHSAEKWMYNVIATKIALSKKKKEEWNAILWKNKKLKWSNNPNRMCKIGDFIKTFHEKREKKTAKATTK